VSRIDDPEAMKKFQVYNDHHSGSDHRGRNPLKFADIKHWLNGYGRIIYYQCNDQEFRSERCNLLRVFEGRFKQGEPDGYNRVFNAPEPAFCELGYWKENSPNGKYQRFDHHGNCLEQGIRDGSELTKEIEINSYQTRLIKTANNIGKAPGGQIYDMRMSKANKERDYNQVYDHEKEYN